MNDLGDIKIINVYADLTASSGEESALPVAGVAREAGSVNFWVRKIPGAGKWQPNLVFLPENLRAEGF